MKHEPAYNLSITRPKRAAGRSSRGQTKPPMADAGIRKAIHAVLRKHGVDRARISVALADDDTLARLNRNYLNHRGSTDVLTFDLRDADDGKRGIDGEIVMSVDAAAKRARELGHAVTAELALYAVHGTLHLLGYDDRHKADAARMHAVEDEVLSSLGWGPVFAKGS